MENLLWGCMIMVGGAAAGLALGAKSRLTAPLAVISLWVGCLAAIHPVAAALTGHAPPPLTLAWSIPLGAFVVGMDALSAFFFLPLLILAPLAALYGWAYLGKPDRGTGPAWFCFNLLTASMMLVFTARNGLLFLLAWEIMAVSSFFLVVREHHQSSVRRAGWTYLVATHLGTAFLLVFFALMGGRAASFDFARFNAAGALPHGLASGLFVLALAGFGCKAGIMPLHVWLPEAHPAAPSHVSALMSAVMIKTGVYGLLRTLTFLGAPPAAWGWTLVVIGLASGVMGVILTLAQHDLKRLLAYCSVENIGIIHLGLGVGLLGLSWHHPLMAALGLGGGLLHLLNHALFKGLLFMGAGAVLHASGTREMDRLGGLIKTMPWTGTLFLVGAAAICGLPPFNGFISEFLIYAAGIQAANSHAPQAILLAGAVLGGLALLGGLAAAAFTKSFGLVFLGEPRDQGIGPTHEAPWAMRLPMALLAVLCLAVGLGAAAVPALLAPVVDLFVGHTAATAWPAGIGRWLAAVAGIGLLLVVATSALFLLRRRLAARRGWTVTGTWDCGYARPTPRMQYTTSSYAQPLVDLFHACLGTQRIGRPVAGFFPAAADFADHTPDAARKWLFAPLFRGVERVLAPLRLLQHGRIHLYVLYVAVVLIALLLWKGGV
jgi:hydrogenase-4 component B